MSDSDDSYIAEMVTRRGTSAVPNRAYDDDALDAADHVIARNEQLRGVGAPTFSTLRSSDAPRRSGNDAARYFLRRALIGAVDTSAPPSARTPPTQ